MSLVVTALFAEPVRMILLREPFGAAIDSTSVTLGEGDQDTIE